MISLDKAIGILAERTYENRQDIRQKNLQRRHQVVDLYGVEYTRLGDANSPAVIYVSISPDMEYIERFQFKLIISAFSSTVGSFTSEGTGTIDPTTLTVEYDIDENALGNDNYNLEFQQARVTPNPHTHTLSGITLTATPGITATPTYSTNFNVIFFDPENDPSATNGVNITPFLRAQYNGGWISGMGVYPSLKIDEDYDILQVACDMEGLGMTEARKLLTDPGYKGIMITSDSPFGVTLVNYLKYSHLNR